MHNLGPKFNNLYLRFLWNTYLISPLLAFRRSLPIELRSILDREAFIVRAIQVITHSI